MAKPIKETPILYGEDAKRFVKSIENKKPLSKVEKQRMEKNYNFLKSILQE